MREAVENGADGVGVAGGDGTQAVVAAIAAERGLPYVCVPAGTRNHFALDLGVDRDVVGALDAFTKGGERLVNLAEVNGRVFVNNLSLGVYAEAVQREGYRDAKLRTIAETMPTVLGPGGDALDLRFTGADGRERKTTAVVLVSNDPYRPGRALVSGTRPRLDAGVLGITAVGAGKAGGESACSSGPQQLRSPLRRLVRGWHRRRSSKARPAAALSHQATGSPCADRSATSGRLPTATMPESPWDAILAVARVAIHGSS